MRGQGENHGSGLDHLRLADQLKTDGGSSTLTPYHLTLHHYSLIRYCAPRGLLVLALSLVFTLSIVQFGTLSHQYETPLNQCRPITPSRPDR